MTPDVPRPQWPQQEGRGGGGGGSGVSSAEVEQIVEQAIAERVPQINRFAMYGSEQLPMVDKSQAGPIRGWYGRGIASKITFAIGVEPLTNFYNPTATALLRNGMFGWARSGSTAVVFMTLQLYGSATGDGWYEWNRFGWQVGGYRTLMLFDGEDGTERPPRLVVPTGNAAVSGVPLSQYVFGEIYVGSHNTQHATLGPEGFWRRHCYAVMGCGPDGRVSDITLRRFTDGPVWQPADFANPNPGFPNEHQSRIVVCFTYQCTDANTKPLGGS